ncbi:DMT family transporter [Thioalkalicoccus limnaeus]|uniref:DMT family transporter n=1 Tax=Thioalkalicoccus limnaeus TaxID=120681 RepID=A0ABV4B9K7_9GAMM
MDFAPYAHLWVVFALLSAFFHASRMAATKWLSLTLPVPVLTIYVNLASLAVTLPLILWYHDFPLSSPEYLMAVLLGGLASGLGGWALNYAIHESEVSLVGPIMTSTPGFVILLEWLLIGSLPGALGFLGIALLMVGSYWLSAGQGLDRWYRPLQHLITNPGSRYALIASACFAAASTLGRIGIQLSDPLSFAVMVAVVNPLILFILFSVREPGFYRELVSPSVRQVAGPLLLLGLLFALMRIADQIALSLTLASYAMAVKRTAGLFAVLLGGFFFREGHLVGKLLACLVMLFGVLALTLD